MKPSLVITLLLLSMIVNAQNSDKPLIKKLQSTEWEFRQSGEGQWLPVSIPSSVHTALMKNGVIPDPYAADNEASLQWIEEKDWEYRCRFKADKDVLDQKHIELRFDGLDTYAQVFLNDTLILETDNMFRRWTADVKGLLKEGDNELHVYFESPVKKVKQSWEDLGYELPGGIRTMTRKAQFHYGWDWGPKLVGCGILKTPEIVAWNDFIFEDVFFTTSSITEEKARVVAHFRYRSDIEGKVTVIIRESKTKSIDYRTLRTGVQEDSVWFDLPNPKLWWCNGMGEPHLYDFSLEVRNEITTLDFADVRTGIRTIELITEPDKNGESFYFKINGKPVFCKGANYIPQDMFQDRVKPSQYKRLLDDVRSSNMNMLRVWGGGIYEDELFYQLCDARGILVWQDFMYACAMYPGKGSFLKNAAAEAREQIERLRNHPCIALWCGNNENDEAWHHWGWQVNFNEAQRAQVWRDYLTLFRDVLPTYVNNYSGGVPYWQSSPKYGRANPKSLKEGDAHYWGVWHDEEPFDILNKKVPRFMSEFGFQSFPSWKTISSFAAPAERELESKVMLAHQKHPRGNALIAEYMKRDFRMPTDFESFVYVSQLLQAEGMRTGIEAHRRNKPYCMGTLYWQLNDVWPVASWSSIDYFGNWKAMQYYVREAFSPVAALPFVEDGILKLYGVTDLGADTVVSLQVKALSFDGKTLSDVSVPDVRIAADSSRMIWQGYLKTVLDRHKEEDAVVVIELKNNAGKEVYRRLFYLAPPKKLSLARPKIQMAVEALNEGYLLTLQSNKLAKNVMLQTEAPGTFSDNFFDLLPGEPKTIRFKSEQLLADPENAFTLKSLVEAQ